MIQCLSYKIYNKYVEQSKIYSKTSHPDDLASLDVGMKDLDRRAFI